MNIGRRTASGLRRRRVLVCRNLHGPDPASRGDQRRVERLRQARRAPATYGSSVNRRLRGRWFSLVPVRRSTLLITSALILGVACSLVAAHWAAASWPPLAYRSELARPLRLDRPDSFGSWCRAAFLMAAAATALLVYQLRRYRNDDFRGSYRIWPPVIVLVALASVDSIARLTPWLGELIDWSLGRRVALAGGDWIRIVLTVGGAALAIRMLAELRHSKAATALTLLTTLLLALPLAAGWQILQVDSPARWLLVTSAPLLASATLWLAFGIYLRKLFREVRRIDDQPLWPWPRRRQHHPGQPATAAQDRLATASRRSPAVSSPRDTSHPGSSTSTAATSQPARRRWLPWLGRRPKPAQAAQPRSSQKPQVQPAQRQPEAAPPAQPAAGLPRSTQQAVATAKQPQRRGLLARLLRRRGQPDPAANSDRQPDRPAGDAQPAKRPAQQDGRQGDASRPEAAGDDAIDWSSLSKAERRRRRREMKREGRAA